MAKTSRRPKTVISAAIGLVLLAGGVLVWMADNFRSRHQIGRVLVIVDQRGKDRDVCSGARGGRPVYPYSVIRGGVCSGAELERAVMTDPAAAVHYSDVIPGHFRLARLERPVAAYVSYRKEQSVFWTARRVWLAANEYVLTDGAHHIRARCGNRISTAQVAPTAPQEEIVRVAMNQPEPLPMLPPLPETPAPAPPQSAALPDVPNARRHSIYPWVPPVKDPPLPPPTRPDWAPPLIITPEPGTLVLTGGVLAGWGVYTLFRRRRRKTERDHSREDG